MHIGLAKDIQITCLGSVFKIEQGKSNVVADFVSCLHVLEDPTIIDDRFPDEDLFSITTQNPGYVDIANYLTTRRSPSHLSPKECRLLPKKFF